MSDFIMPSLGADMEAGTLVEWLVAPGDVVHRGQTVAVVETQKGAIEVEIFEDGKVAELCVPVGREVPVGTVLARLEGAERPLAVPAPAARPEPAPAAVAAPPPARRPATPPGARHRVTPLARRRAAELGVSLAGLAGTGVEGAVRLADVEAAASAKPAAEAGAMRRAIAAAMTRSHAEIPHYWLTLECDLARALAWMERINAELPVARRLMPAALFLKATALALRQKPGLNGYWQDGAFVPGPGIHVGWAVALRGGGLIAPALHDADLLPLDALMEALRDLIGRARGGGLRSSELGEATITVTSLGERGADEVMGLIHPPQVALVGFGRIAERPVVAEGAVLARPSVRLSLAADHRASDGHQGSLLLAAINALLQTPEAL
ncbi:dihydrolipoamide acetyltransferase family protein [Geminicoccaceae bacterium 1502E]|nr:dihydrolipoamide acetyltransferase family protein [Geminicoccaceae bacterium 1502E]